MSQKALDAHEDMSGNVLHAQILSLACQYDAAVLQWQKVIEQRLPSNGMWWLALADAYARSSIPRYSLLAIGAYASAHAHLRGSLLNPSHRLSAPVKAALDLSDSLRLSAFSLPESHPKQHLC